MKNFKKIAAILGVIVLLAVCCLPMIFAFGSGENAQGNFKAAVGCVILVPVLAYVFFMVYKLLKKDEKEADGKVKNIIFDVGKVLVSYDWEGYLESFHFPAEEEKLIGEKVFKSQIWNERDRGALTEEEYRKQFAQALPPEYADDLEKVIIESGRTIEAKDYAETWTSYLKSQGYHLYILSNYSEYMLEQTRSTQMPFLKNMDGVIFSCEVKQIKPDADIYETLLSRFGLKPEESVFLDDRPENCEAARALGIHAIQFHDLKQAAKELEKLGVK
ncbi:HAD family hydrolase [Blautia sp. HCP3S3_H10_1]|uniref:HAD family hydrolase n=1 Tax=unclassified Blautia TaxID=2648079 RepID=UPI003F912646|nr:HAD family phosphatase [Clostridia bacterium]